MEFEFVTIVCWCNLYNWQESITWRGSVCCVDILSAFMTYTLWCHDSHATFSWWANRSFHGSVISNLRSFFDSLLFWTHHHASALQLILGLSCNSTLQNYNLWFNYTELQSSTCLVQVCTHTSWVNYTYITIIMFH